MDRAPVRQRLEPLIVGGAVARCGILELEVLFTARNHAELVATRRELHGLQLVAIGQQDFDRASEVMELLARRGSHRAARLPDLVLAAAAERTGLAVLHYDHHFDSIAAVTRQPVEWVVPSGTVD